MGDRGGKKDKDKHKQQQLKKHKQDEQKKQDRLPKGSSREAGGAPTPHF